MRPIVPHRFQPRALAASSTPDSDTITAAGTIHTKGAWVQLAVPSFDWSGILIAFNGGAASGTDTAALMDLYVGDGSQNPVRPIVDNLVMGSLNTSYDWIEIPLPVPSGQEIIGRVQAATINRPYPLMVTGWGAAPGVALPHFAKVTTIGADTGTSRGVVLTEPTVANTKSDWTEVSASTPQEFHRIGLGITPEWVPGYSSANYVADIGVGPAGSEQVIVPNYYFSTGNNETIARFFPPGLFLPAVRPIAAGSRLAIRYQGNVIASGLTAVLYGVS